MHFRGSGMATTATQPCENASLWQVIKRRSKEWSEDRASLLAAAVAYYAIFSIGPLLIIFDRGGGDDLRPAGGRWPD